LLAASRQPSHPYNAPPHLARLLDHNHTDARTTMATFMPANSAAAGRRKKVVTYGKSTRLSTSTPQLGDDAPLPDEQRQPVANPGGALKGIGGKAKAADTLKSMRAVTRSPDIFDVPSEDEFAPPPPKPTGKPPAKSRIQGRETGTTRKSDGQGPKLKASKTTQPLRKPDAAKPVASAAKEPAKPVTSQRQAQTQIPSSNSTVVPATRRAKTPQVTQSTIQDKTNAKAVQRSVAKPKAAPQAIPPARAAPNTQSKSGDAFRAITKKSAKDSAAQSADLDVFDMPSSDEETALPMSKVLNHKSTGRLKRTANAAPPSAGVPQKDPPESDESNASHGRKRKGSISTATATKSVGATEVELSLPQRGRKYQKKADDASPGHVSKEPPVSVAPAKSQQADPSNSRPKKARIRTVPAFTKAVLAKGQSSPASLGMMLPKDQLLQQTPKTPAVEDKVVDDETMYEIPDSLVTPMRKSLGSTPGSVTPRQKDLFHGLLGDSSASKISIPPMSSLQLSDQKPRSLLGALARSKSDLTHSAHSRKTSLIHTLKRDETSSDDDSESEEETIIDPATTQEARSSQPRQDLVKVLSNKTDMDVNMDIENDAAVETQTSQASSVTVGRPRLTYAKSRSYLQESNFEDELLISMDLDNDIKFSSQRKEESGTEDEEDPASQVRGHHELKKQGQYDMFYWDTEASIDDISNSNSSIRRSALIEFCTKMADRKFVAQLLDSSLFQRFLKSLTSHHDAVFDFTAAGAIIFILQTDPPYAVLEQICQPDINKTIIKLLSNDNEIQQIAQDRKIRASPIAQESIVKFSILLQDSIWTAHKPEKLTPQIIAMKAIELIALGVRESRNTTDLLLTATELLKILNIGGETPRDPCTKVESWNKDPVVTQLAFSILEAASTSRQQRALWSKAALEKLSLVCCMYFLHNKMPDMEYRNLPTLAIKLCMNLTNNRPEACKSFAMDSFTRPVIHCMVRGFRSLFAGTGQSERTEILETLLLSLGVMINLAEFSDLARSSCDDKSGTIRHLVDVFLEGSERAAQVCASCWPYSIDVLLTSYRPILWRSLSPV
jgi:hypothetical protein